MYIYIIDIYIYNRYTCSRPLNICVSWGKFTQIILRISGISDSLATQIGGTYSTQIGCTARSPVSMSN